MDLDRLAPKEIVLVGQILTLLGTTENDEDLRRRRTILEGCIRVVDTQLERNKQTTGE